MKSSVRILFVMLAALLLPIVAMAQTETRSVPKYEISIGGGAGMSGMGIMDKSAFTKGSPFFSEYYNAPRWSPAIGGHFGLYADFNFTDHLGLITGLEGAAYLTYFYGTDVLSSSTYPYYDPYVINAPARPWFTKASAKADDMRSWILCQIGDFTEEHLMISVQIPVMFKYMTPIKPLSPHRYYLAVGAKLGIHASPDIWFQNGTPGKFGALRVQDGLLNGGSQKPVYEYGKTKKDGVPNGTSWSWAYIHNEDINPVDVLLSLDTGFRWRLADKVGLYTGLYCDFGLIRPVRYHADTAKKLLEFDPSTVHEKGGLENDPYAKWEGAIHSSLVTAASPDYLTYDNTGVYPEYTDKPYVKFLNNMQAGVKVRVSFAVGGKKDKAPKVKEPKQPKEPKEPKQPKQKVEKVPPKIQKTMMELSDALFAFDKFDLNEDARRMLDEVTEWLKENPELNVEIGGHTDSRGSDAYNQKLSENRAKAVYDYFVSHGVSADRLSYKGYGESRPIATNDTDEGRQRNRRVELQIQ